GRTRRSSATPAMPDRNRLATSRRDEIDIAVVLQELKISCKVKFQRPAHFHFGETRDFGDVPLAIAPIKRYGDELVPGTRGVAAPLIFGKIIHRDGAE